jgi:hypothetical protein
MGISKTNLLVHLCWAQRIGFREPGFVRINKYGSGLYLRVAKIAKNKIIDFPSFML